MKYIKLTSFYSKDLFRLQSDFITAYYKLDSGTVVDYVGGSVRVDETPEEIDGILGINNV